MTGGGGQMHIINLMLDIRAGGIEQAFVDYCEGLKSRGHRITAVTHPRAVVNAQLKALGVSTITMRNLGEWDVFAARRLRRRLQILKPDVTISHTHRSYALAQRATAGLFPLVGTAHNYHSRTRRAVSADAVFATTHDLMDVMIRHGVPENRIFHIPNMVRCHELPSRDGRHIPPVIGSLGRFVKKKGFDVFIDALALLKKRGYSFSAVLGGIGGEARHLKKRARRAGLRDVLDFPGWVKDKRAFYTGLDLFCLPSLHEPFGIVLLEAFVHGVPVIATDSEGPHDIITPNFDALIVPIGNAEAMADALAKLLDNVPLADNLAANAFAKAKMAYSIETVCARIEKALEAVLQQGKK